MLKFIIVFIFVSSFTFGINTRVKQYRYDYEYNEQMEAFYKLHSKPALINEAENICSQEGATWVASASFEELLQIHSMMKRTPDIEYVFVAPIPQNDQYGPVPLNLNSYEKLYCKNDIISRAGDKLCVTLSDSDSMPFVCKKEARTVYYNLECDVYVPDYNQISMYVEDSCYKVATTPRTWEDAKAECEAEGAHLVVINSITEFNAIKYRLKREFERDYYFIGVRAYEGQVPRVFYTVFNETLDEVGFSTWEDTEPNNKGNDEFCVTLDLWRYGKYNDYSCDVKQPYICEKNLNR